jgi:hypothetical protein
MINKKGFIKKTMLFAVLLLLFLGTFSIAKAAPENDLSELIEFSTFLGGTGDDCIETVAYAFGSTTVDSLGNIIVVGRTESTDFPLKDAYQDHINGFSDGTLSKFSPNGSLIFSTYFGGSEQEVPTEVAVDSEDNIIVVGITGSSDFPLMNPLQSNFTGGSEGNADCFITKFSEDGQSLLFSTYFGGAGSDWCYTMDVDSDNRIVISGTTESTSFPLLNAYQDTLSGASDVFLSFIEADGQSLLFSTYLGTPEVDHGRRVVFNSKGDILLAGIVGNGDLATEDAYQEDNGGGTDAFLAKFNANGTLLYFTFLGGSLVEWANDLAVDSEDNAILAGFTASTDFPTVNAYQDERNASIDMFITKFSPNGQNIVFSTYLGGSSEDYGNAITTDSHDRIIVTGQTTSADFPTTIPYSTTGSYYKNATLVVLGKDGSLLLSTAFGGGNHDIGIGVAWHSDDSYVIIGYTASAAFPVHEAYQGTYGGDNDMFVMKMNLQGLIDILQDGFPFDLMVGSAAIGVIVVVVLLLFVRKRTG